jgi:hypothetical protein
VFNRYRSFDFSSVPFSPFSTSYTQYDAAFSVGSYDLTRNKCDDCPADSLNDLLLLVVGLYPTNNLKKITYSVDTIDILIGNIGGFIGLVYMLWGSTIASFEDFRRDLSLVQSFYSYEKP